MKADLKTKLNYLLAAIFVSSSMVLAIEAALIPNPQQIGSVVHIDFMPPALPKAEAPLHTYLAHVRREKGLVGIRLLQQISAPNHFTMIEIWSDKKAYDFHQSSPNLKTLRDEITPLLGAPWDERVHSESLQFPR